MRTAIALTIGLLGGFLAGILLNQLLGAAALVLLDSPEPLRAFRFLPGITAITGAVVTVVLEQRGAGWRGVTRRARS